MKDFVKYTSLDRVSEDRRHILKTIKNAKDGILSDSFSLYPMNDSGYAKCILDPSFRMPSLSTIEKELGYEAGSKQWVEAVKFYEERTVIPSVHQKRVDAWDGKSSHDNFYKWMRPLYTLLIERREMLRKIETKLSSNYSEQTEVDCDISEDEEVEYPFNSYRESLVDLGSYFESIIDSGKEAPNRLRKLARYIEFLYENPNKSVFSTAPESRSYHSNLLVRLDDSIRSHISADLQKKNSRAKIDPPHVGIIYPKSLLIKAYEQHVSPDVNLGDNLSKTLKLLGFDALP